MTKLSARVTPYTSILDDRLTPFFSSSTQCFTDRRFLSSLESSLSVGGQTGWQPAHLLVESDNQTALVLGYLKYHSYGEYVFDWALANMYERAGLNYYPKWISGIPFTPIVGKRVLGDNIEGLSTIIQDWIVSQDLSGAHVLFNEESSFGSWAQRTTVQFKWRNRGYRTFDDYLDQLKSSKRKSIKKERKKLAQQQVCVRRFYAAEITDEVWKVMYQCYQATYQKRSGHNGYLTANFFGELLSSMRDYLMVVQAKTRDQAIASALFLVDKDALYGRYWGALEQVDGLHFECAFYQGIEFAIEHGISVFDAGAQGEHKLIRGFEPEMTHSWHWLAHSQANDAMVEWAREERDQHQQYFEVCLDAVPYKSILV